MASAAETTPRSRRRSLSWRRVGTGAVPYGLILPVVVVLGAILGYPIYSLVRLSLQQYGLFELIRHQGRYVGLHNFVLTELHVGNFFHHDWYATTFSQLGIVTVLIVWGALPFVIITVYAALSQVPGELVEAAEIDGARPWQVFLDVTMPVIRPVLL